MSRSARDRWRALPREVREALIDWHADRAARCVEYEKTCRALGNMQRADWFRDSAEGNRLAAQLLRQAARRENKR